MGDPVFEAVLRQIEVFPLPGCLHRSEVQVPGASRSVVGYAATERNADCGRFEDSFDQVTPKPPFMTSFLRVF